jgi:protein-S-isoprenylcysteine O-methyltransferase Ste14
MVWRFLPLIGAFLLIAIACIWRPWLQFRRYGMSGIMLFRSGGIEQKLRDLLAILLFGLVFQQAIVAAVWPRRVSLISVGDQATQRVFQIVGLLLLFGGLALLVAAQLYLGASWRIGIDEKAKPGLVTNGPYRFSRHPIFLAMLITFSGYTLLLPTLMSVALLAGIYFGVRLQVSAEESYLLRTYGDGYREYARHVGRLLPGIGIYR